MPLELNDIFVTPDSSLAVEECFVYDDLSAEGEQLAVSPVRVRGQVRNTGGLVELCYTAEFSYSKPCDRCLAVAEKSVRQDFVHTQEDYRESDTSRILQSDWYSRSHTDHRGSDL